MLWFSGCAIFLIGIVNFCESSGKVRLVDVATLTFHKGKYTTGRRSSPLPQIQCIGGSAKGRFEPKVVQCYNKGYDGVDVQWECKAEMNSQYEFGEIRVSCEGYDYPNDPYILHGSCCLKYNLEYSSEGGNNYGKGHKVPSEKNYEFGFPTLLNIAILLLFFFTVYYCWSQPSTDSDRIHRNGSSWDQGPPPPPGYGRPPQPGFKRFMYGTDAPPTYEESFYNSPRAQSQFSGVSFLSGLGLGGLTGYLYSRNQNSEDSFLRGRRPYGSRSSWSGSHADDSPGPSSRTTSGFGETERR